MVNDTERPPFDSAKALDLVGKCIIIGLTYEDRRGQLIHKEQLHGVVESADSVHGIRVALRGTRAGDYYILPPDLRAVQQAAPGEYRLRSTGEVVKDPDYLSTWVVTPPDEPEAKESADA